MATINVKITKGSNVNVVGDSGSIRQTETETDSLYSNNGTDLEYFKSPFDFYGYDRSQLQPGPLEQASNSIVLKTPWVPAPALSTKQTTISLYPLRNNKSNNDIKGTSSAVSVNSSQRRKRFTKTNKSFIDTNYTPRKSLKYTSSRRAAKGKPYSLRSKDSLVDVTACLNEKREQLMTIWQDHLASDDTNLLNQLKNTNELAMEAATDVGKLRDSIQSLQKKSALTKADNELLENQRNKVMEKLNAFEEANSEIHKLLESRASHKSLEDLQLLSKYSQASLDTNDERKASRMRSKSQGAVSAPAESRTDVVFLKNKPENFSDRDTDNDNENGLASESNSNSAIKTCDSSSQIDLSNLNRLYNEKYELPEVKETYTDTKVFHAIEYEKKENVPLHQEKIRRVVRFQDHHEESERFYKEKLVDMQRKLASQESEMSNLKTELHRIESQSGFQLNLLKTNIKDKLEELEVIPELLQLTEHRIGDSLQSRMFMEQNLKEKDRDINNMKTDIQKMLVELIDTKEKLRRSELMNNTLGFQMQELYKEKERVKLDLDAFQKSSKEKLDEKIKENAALNHQLELALTNQTSFVVDNESKEKLQLEDKILTLEKNLAKADRDVVLSRKSKEKVSLRMNLRVEELMETLEESRRRNRHLINQIQYIKSTYYKLFPPELFYQNGKNPRIPNKPTQKDTTVILNHFKAYEAQQDSNTGNPSAGNSVSMNATYIPSTSADFAIATSHPAAAGTSGPSKQDLIPCDIPTTAIPKASCVAASADKLTQTNKQKKRVVFESPTGYENDTESSETDSDYV